MLNSQSSCYSRSVHWKPDCPNGHLKDKWYLSDVLTHVKGLHRYNHLVEPRLRHAQGKLMSTHGLHSSPTSIWPTGHATKRNKISLSHRYIEIRRAGQRRTYSALGCNVQRKQKHSESFFTWRSHDDHYKQAQNWKRLVFPRERDCIQHSYESLLY